MEVVDFAQVTDEFKEIANNVAKRIIGNLRFFMISFFCSLLLSITIVGDKLRPDKSYFKNCIKTVIISTTPITRLIFLARKPKRVNIFWLKSA